MLGWTDMSKDFFEIFSGCYVINLPERTDRKREILAELDVAGASIDAHRVSFLAADRPDTAGPFPSIGARGCFLSHLAALRAARDAGHETVLILEDDARFTDAFRNDADAVVTALRTRDWDIFYGGYDAKGAVDPQGVVGTVDPGAGSCWHTRSGGAGRWSRH